ncbi:MAG TPA: FAD-binding oxidoreductase, partial [Bacteroidetes bacterium]|nr:FAD-binding oxidoreductase [Bacteroidota bacterium]HEX04547.1 FAD-binding oxidoreductase [Bacteroidota bacterium]
LGLSLADLIRIVLPAGWFLPVTPGTRQVTVGGCVAADVHGKNHLNSGTISRHVLWLDLLTAGGEIIRCSAEENSDLFHATTGGMGLTGVILRVAMRLRKAETSFMKVNRLRTANLAETMNALTIADEIWESSVAWIDGLSYGQELGRGEVILGHHAKQEDLTFKLSVEPHRMPDESRLSIPFDFPLNVLRQSWLRVFNSHRFKRITTGESMEDIWQFHYPLDALNGWNRLYGPLGFHQYQFVIPDQGAESFMGYALKRLQNVQESPVLVVLKRFGAGAGWLSFPIPGWTMAVDLPYSPRLFDVLEKLDKRVVTLGGRVYLAKDERVLPKHFREMYPDIERWLEVKRNVDPTCRFTSDLSRRLLIDQEIMGSRP